MARFRTNVNTYRFHGVRITLVTPGQTAFARALLVLLNDHGWSQRRIAKAMGLSHAQVARYLEGQEPTLARAALLADEAEVSLDWLAGREAHRPQVVVDGEPYEPVSGGSSDRAARLGAIEESGEVAAAKDARRGSKSRRR